MHYHKKYVDENKSESNVVSLVIKIFPNRYSYSFYFQKYWENTLEILHFVIHVDMLLISGDSGVSHLQNLSLEFGLAYPIWLGFELHVPPYHLEGVFSTLCKFASDLRPFLNYSCLKAKQIYSFSFIILDSS